MWYTVIGCFVSRLYCVSLVNSRPLAHVVYFVLTVMEGVGSVDCMTHCCYRVIVITHGLCAYLFCHRFSIVSVLYCAHLCNEYQQSYILLCVFHTRLPGLLENASLFYIYI